MILTEKQIILRMEKLMRFEFTMEKTTATELIAWTNNVLNLLKTILPSNSSQIQKLEVLLHNYLLSEKISNGFVKGNLYSKFIGFLMAIFSDYNEGFLKDLRIEIRAEVEIDFLSQAGSLFEEKLKDPAAMLIGAVLEDVLRQLCKKYGVQEGPNIESMNAPLKKAGAYGLPEQQQITAWAAIRNKADHAHFNEYDLAQVKLMHQGVTDFIAKYLS